LNRLNAVVTTAERSRQCYERRPYPGAELADIVRKGKSIPSLKWMQAVGRPGKSPPERVLVAGCGTGAEAFVMRRRLPKAEIVAVDFSTRSIAMAERFQRKVGATNPVKFLVGDLTDPDLAARTGGDFDLITCHGVLSYIPEPVRVLKSFGTCLRLGGALYLGVNGESHPATKLRPWLAGLGLEVDEMRDERRLRQLLGLWDALHDDGIGELAHMSASYLASDVCGPHFNNWAMARWRAAAREGGWEIGGVALLPLALRLTMEGENYRPVLPASVGELAERMDQIRSASFHQILLRRPTPASASGRQGSASDGKLLWTGLYSARFTKSEDPLKELAVLSCPTFNLRLEWPLAPRQADAVRELATAGATSPQWKRQWGRSAAGQGILDLWAGFGVVAAEDVRRTVA